MAEALIRTAINLFVIILSFSFVLPFTISANDNLIVALGFIYLVILLPMFIWNFNKDYVEKVAKEIRETSEPPKDKETQKQAELFAMQLFRLVRQDQLKTYMAGAKLK